MLDILHNGLGAADLALTANRIAVGAFFAISGYHKLFNRERHESLVKTLEADHVPAIRFNQWWVPGVELAAGVALIAGFLAPLAALGILALMCVACLVDGRKRVAEYGPIDAADRLDDWLYLPEVCYLLMAAIVILAGPGAFTIA